MSAQLKILSIGYAGERVAGTVALVRDGDFIAVIDPGMVANRSMILDPLAAAGVDTGAVTDVVFSHHHPDHTVNAALFPNARVHDFQATYQNDLWVPRQFADDSGVSSLSDAVCLVRTPGHTAQDVTTLVETQDGLVACTHLWWSEFGPVDDPFATDRDVLRASRERVLAMNPALIVPGHGAPFAPDTRTPF
ncbi:Glyoxylase, beta-lactamase superfamily II [Asanoa ishikariensis]|uniref:Metallo-beta-lactamase domain-containing protein 1 n=1 Tax=Asanoa ishikariensis TaxID=137265 RepID=A0A1H3UAG8_9ACTN|nr:MBL fold metallo-hydrolase [Asanoa ishikariensis]SDZ58579.1 Glyoxylase, beta-lactamase superfamily II [Asanoa ishikariensis]